MFSGLLTAETTTIWGLRAGKNETVRDENGKVVAEPGRKYFQIVDENTGKKYNRSSIEFQTIETPSTGTAPTVSASIYWQAEQLQLTNQKKSANDPMPFCLKRTEKIDEKGRLTYDYDMDSEGVNRGKGRTTINPPVALGGGKYKVLAEDIPDDIVNVKKPQPINVVPMVVGILDSEKSIGVGWTSETGAPRKRQLPQMYTVSFEKKDFKPGPEVTPGTWTELQTVEGITAGSLNSDANQALNATAPKDASGNIIAVQNGLPYDDMGNALDAVNNALASGNGAVVASSMTPYYFSDGTPNLAWKNLKGNSDADKAQAWANMNAELKNQTTSEGVAAVISKYNNPDNDTNQILYGAATSTQHQELVAVPIAVSVEKQIKTSLYDIPRIKIVGDIDKSVELSINGILNTTETDRTTKTKTATGEVVEVDEKEVKKTQALVLNIAKQIGENYVMNIRGATNGGMFELNFVNNKGEPLMNIKNLDIRKLEGEKWEANAEIVVFGKAKPGEKPPSVSLDAIIGTDTIGGVLTIKNFGIGYVTDTHGDQHKVIVNYQQKM